jgi:hypothetical protein
MESLWEVKEFIAWLEKNKDHFLTYSVEEIANLAKMAGFNPMVVNQWQTREKFRRVQP